MHSKIYLLLIFLILSCGNKGEYKTVNIDSVVSIEVPSDWSYRVTRGIDGYTFEVSKGNSIIQGEIGEFANQLRENSYPVYDIRLKDSLVIGVLKSVDPIGYYFSELPQEDYELKVFAKQYYMYDTVNGLVVRMSQPKRVGKGVLGIYLKNISKGKGLSMYINDADSAAAFTAMKIFKSLKKL